MNSLLDVASSVLLALDSGKDDFFTTHRRVTNENDNQLRARRWSTVLPNSNPSAPPSPVNSGSKFNEADIDAIFSRVAEEIQTRPISLACSNSHIDLKSLMGRLGHLPPRDNQ
jgi:hypothetical protein